MSEPSTGNALNDYFAARPAPKAKAAKQVPTPAKAPAAAATSAPPKPAAAEQPIGGLVNLSEAKVAADAAAAATPAPAASWGAAPKGKAPGSGAQFPTLGQEVKKPETAPKKKKAETSNNPYAALKKK